MLVTKAFVLFQATSGNAVIKDSDGVSEVIRHGTGVWSIHLTDDLPSTDYVVLAMCRATTTTGAFVAESAQYSRTTSAVTIVCFNSFSTGLDSELISVEIKIKE